MGGRTTTTPWATPQANHRRPPWGRRAIYHAAVGFMACCATTLSALLLAIVLVSPLPMAVAALGLSLFAYAVAWPQLRGVALSLHSWSFGWDKDALLLPAAARRLQIKATR